MNSRISRTIKIGGFDHAGGHVEPVVLGANLPIVIQTMWKDRLSFADIEGEAGEALVKRVEALSRMGCGLLRFAVPDLEAAEVLGQLACMVSMPLVADIHFDYKIALRCMDFPVAKIRTNPGNMGPRGAPSTREKIEAVLSRAAEKNIPIRIGLNAGSLPLDLRKQVEEGMEATEALVKAAERELAIFEEFGFDNVLVSMKASGIADTIKANRILAERSDVLLHVGVTEAGPLVAGVVQSTAALVTLLAEGIGDTIRVSLADTVENEVIAAREILRAAAELPGNKNGRLSRTGVSIVSCPRCGRHGFDTHGFTERWMPYLYSLDKKITVAVMGCEVNGPQEARHADLGITGAADKIIIFRHGKPIRILADSAGADDAFLEELNKL